MTRISINTRFVFYIFQTALEILLIDKGFDNMYFV